MIIQNSQPKKSLNEILKSMNRSMSREDYAELFQNEKVGQIDFSQFLSIMVAITVGSIIIQYSD